MTVARAGGQPATGVVLVGIVHVAATNGRAVARILRRAQPEENVAGLLLYYVASSMLVAAACAGAILSADRLRPLVPQTDKLSEAAWTGLFAAVLAVTLQSLGRDDLSDATLLERARRDVGPGLWRQLSDAASRHGTDGDLLQAIVGAEALQRPAWFRRAERLKGRLQGSGTYGVAQVSAPAPLSDADSVEELARRFEGFLPDRDESGFVLRERLAFAVERHNRKEAFVEMVLAFYDELQGYRLAATDATALDGRPVIEVRSVGRDSGAWVLSGTASVHEATVLWSATGDGYADEGFVTAEIGAPGRGDWKLRLPPDARSVWLQAPSEDDEAEVAPEIVCMVDLNL